MILPRIEVVIPGRITAKKNNYRIVGNGNKRWIRPGAKSEESLQRIVMYTNEAVNLRTDRDFPLADGSPFGIEVVQAVSSARYGDLDGVITTLLDGLEGLLFDNDRYCCSERSVKVIVPKNKDFVWFRITQLPAPYTGLPYTTDSDLLGKCLTFLT